MGGSVGGDGDEGWWPDLAMWCRDHASERKHGCGGRCLEDLANRETQKTNVAAMVGAWTIHLVGGEEDDDTSGEREG